MGTEVAPENELTRANFYDLIVRIGIQKYIKTKKKVGLRQEASMSTVECFHKFMVDNALPSMQRVMAPH